MTDPETPGAARKVSPTPSKPEGDLAGPAAQGFRWPAEWEPHHATWISWPHNSETWPGRLGHAEEAMTGVVSTLARVERVRINVSSVQAEQAVGERLGASGCDLDRVRFFQIPTNDAWVRDHGPIFLVRGGTPGQRQRALVDFGFDAWGGKYPPWDQDDAVPAEIAAALGLPRFAAGFVLEGGSIDGNGAGVALTTESCLLDPRRERDRPRTRELMEERLAHFLGVTHVVWLGAGIAGDDTDGHVDDIARFVAPGVVAACVEDSSSDVNYAPLKENLRRLRAARDASGKPLAVVELPMPTAQRVDGEVLPASYANFYIANEIVLVPTFGAASDERALSILRECFAGGDGVAARSVIGVPSADLVLGLGAIHCLTQQEPAA